MEDKETGELNSSYFIKQCTRNVCSSDNVVDNQRGSYGCKTGVLKRPTGRPQLHSCFLLFSLQVCI